MSANAKTVLLADDSATSVMHLSLLLGRMGLRVVTARDGLEALRLVEKESPDLVLLDLNMPLLDGYSVLRQIRATPSMTRTPVVVVTVEGDDQCRRECDRLGCQGYLTKPVHLAHLHEMVQRHIAFGTAPRGHLRAPYDATVTVVVEAQTRIMRAASLSEGGIYLRSAAPLPLGTRLTVLLPRTGEPLACPGCVLHHQELSAGVPAPVPGFAVAFDPLDARGALHLRDLVKSLLVGGPKPAGGTDLRV